MVDSTTSYFAWIVEYLPKLWAYDQYVERTGITPELLIKQDPPEWMVQSLSVLGYDRIRRFSGDPIRPETLAVSTHYYHNLEDMYNFPVPSAGYNYTPNPRGYQWIRDNIDQRVDDSSGYNRVYISRADASRRTVVNENEVVDTLESLGFKSVQMAQLSFRDQVRLMRECEILVGVHGAGLANMLFARNPTVIELVPEAYRRAHFACLARSLGFRYQNMTVVSLDDHPRQKYRSVKVDTDRMAETIRRVADRGR
ncbi:MULTISPECIES: DUF563 domain-containing protein [unclassified Haloarcula]|uniref:glycosyltransferase family 61 protein n=1 Tax=unclassified Haloarcula TaxID=2624677 RepID=UPI001582FFC1|nr:MULTISPECIES: glycosyltransferase family 61 protein [unclassified Haloarcula]